MGWLAGDWAGEEREQMVYGEKMLGARWRLAGRYWCARGWGCRWGDAGVPGRDSTRMDLMALGWGCGVLVPVPRCCRVLAGGGADAGLP